MHRHREPPGLGKVRHLDTRHLWLQERVQCGQVLLDKCPAESNLADIGTKPLNGKRFQELAVAAGQWVPDNDDDEAGDADSHGDKRKLQEMDDESVVKIIKAVVCSLRR